MVNSTGHELDMAKYIRHSNLIENIDNEEEDRQSLAAWNWLLKQKEITKEVVLRLHKLITTNQLPQNLSGHYRDCWVKVGDYYAPGPLYVAELMDSWIANKSSDPKFMHIWFEKIHPFADGNGRTGRMLMWWHELQNGKLPTFLDVNDRASYYRWFRISIPEMEEPS